MTRARGRRLPQLSESDFRVLFAHGRQHIRHGQSAHSEFIRIQPDTHTVIALTEDPTHGNPLRVKGGGEAGITPALAVVMNAIMDALKDHGVEHMDMPATPHRIWSAIQRAKSGHAAR